MTYVADVVLLVFTVSTCLVSTAWVLSKTTRSILVKEVLWKTAIALSILAPLLLRPLTAAQSQANVAVIITDRTLLDAFRAAPPTDKLTIGGRVQLLAGPGPTWLPLTSEQMKWARVAALLLLLAGLVRLCVHLVSWRREVKALGLRSVVKEAALTKYVTETFATMGGRSTVRITSVRGLASPIAFSSREIVVPEEDVHEMDRASFMTVIAHELAHIVRGDLRWMRLLSGLSALCFYQPLFALARRELSAIAEFAADDAAILSTNRKTELAQALLHYARRYDPASQLPGLSMTGRSNVVQRVARILGRGERRRASRRLHRLLPTVLSIVCIAVAREAGASALTGTDVMVTHEAADGWRMPDVPSLPPPFLRVPGSFVTGPGRLPQLRVSQTIDGSLREIEVVRTTSGAIQVDYAVDGRPAPFTAATRAWALSLLP